MLLRFIRLVCTFTVMLFILLYGSFKIDWQNARGFDMRVDIRLSLPEKPLLSYLSGFNANSTEDRFQTQGGISSRGPLGHTDEGYMDHLEFNGLLLSDPLPSEWARRLGLEMLSLMLGMAQ